MKALIERIKQSDFIKNFIAFYQNSELDLTSIAVAYYMLITIFPLFFMVSALLPYTGINPDDILSFLAQALPKQIYGSVDNIVRSILTKPSTSWLGISIATALWTLSHSMVMLQKAFNKAYGIQVHRDIFISRVIGIVVGFVIQIIMAVAIFLAVFGPQLAAFIQKQLKINMEWMDRVAALTQPSVYVTLVLSLLMLYYVLPNVRIKKLRYILPGTAFVVLVLATTSQLVSLYLGNYLTRYSDFRLVSYFMVLVMMIWFIFIAKLLIFGAMLNASYQAKHEEVFTLRRSTIGELLTKFKKSKEGVKE